MKILIEGYYYDPKQLDKELVVVKEIFPSHNREGKVCFNYVGHIYSPQINDYIFFLPKVILTDQSDTVFGISPEEIISINEKDNKLSSPQRDFVSEFAVWIYRALMVYRTTHPNHTILSEHNIAQVAKNTRKRLSNTLLDVILEMIQFNKDNQDFVLFTLKNIHSGNNKIQWEKTISKTQCIFEKDKPIYINPINKRKQVNFDEELFIIYYSILNYVAEHYGFRVSIKFGFELITGHKFQNYIDHIGKRRLKQIKYKYFSDRALRMWELCYAFFDKAHPVKVDDNQKEYLLAQNFNIIFEAMIDDIIGSKDIPSKLKDQQDGKRVDHLYTYDDLVYPSEEQLAAQRQIFYIGDSKYYKIGAKIGEESVYKQYTYAHNVIHWNLELFLSDDEKKKQKENPQNIWLRDENTEGYNIVPNFFISAFIDDSLKYENDALKSRGNFIPTRQFENRLFDRDTLLVSHYDVNFLFIISLYARNKKNEQSTWKSKVRKYFRTEIQNLLNKDFNFYALAPHTDVNTEQYIKEHFRELIGKVYSPFADKQVLSLALDKDFNDENEALLHNLKEAFYVCQFKIGEDNPIPQLQEIGYTTGASEHTTQSDWVLLIERTCKDDQLRQFYQQIIHAEYIAVGIGLTAGAIDIEPAMMMAKYVVVHNKRQGKLSCIKGKPHLVAKKDIINDDKFFIAKDLNSDFYIVYQLDHSTQPPIPIVISEILKHSDEHAFDTRFVKLNELI